MPLQPCPGRQPYPACQKALGYQTEVVLQAAEEEHRKLLQTKALGDHACGLLHGRMSSEDKIAALQAFSSGETPVLLSTTVIEVCLTDTS